MKVHSAGVLFVMAVICGLSLWSVAEVEVELTIEGTPEEIMQVLELLRSNGIGTEAEAPGLKEPEAGALQFQMESSVPVPAEDVAEAIVPADEVPPPPPPALRLENGAVTPEEVLPGQQVVVTVAVVDEGHVVDTVSAKVLGADLAVDLYDNGTSGDAVANDGQWTGVLTVPAEAAPRSFGVVISAYDGNGQELMEQPGGEHSATSRARLQVVKPVEAPAPEVVEPAVPGGEDGES